MHFNGCLKILFINLMGKLPDASTQYATIQYTSNEYVSQIKNYSSWLVIHLFN